MSCASCGAKLPERANFCPNCGNRVQRGPAAGPPAPDSVWRRPGTNPPSPPVATPRPWEPGPAEGDSMPAGAVSTAPQRQPAATAEAPQEQRITLPWEANNAPLPSEEPQEPLSASPLVLPLTTLEIAALVGLAVATLGTVLPWVTSTLGSFEASASGWSGLAEFQIAGWLGLDWPIDATVIVVLAAIAAFVRVSGVLRIPGPDVLDTLPVAGAMIAVIGALNWYYIESTSNDFGVKTAIGVGLYAVIAGGIITVVCALLDDHQQTISQQTETA